MKARLAGIIPNSMTNGPGLRYTIFFQGCPHACKGCHNVETWDEKGGEFKEIDKIKEEILKNSCIIRGITLSGGEPFRQIEAATELARYAHSLNLDVWCYTGYVYEVLIKKQESLPLLKEIDVLADGRFIETLKDDRLKWRGSSNQRLLKLEKGQFVDFFDKK